MNARTNATLGDAWSSTMGSIVTATGAIGTTIGAATSLINSAALHASAFELATKRQLVADSVTARRKVVTTANIRSLEADQEIVTFLQKHPHLTEAQKARELEIEAALTAAGL